MRKSLAISPSALKTGGAIPAPARARHTGPGHSPDFPANLLDPGQTGPHSITHAARNAANGVGAGLQPHHQQEASMQRSDVDVQSILAAAHWTFTTRRVDRNDATALSADFASAQAGDLVLCEVTEISQHRRLQLTSKRYKRSYVGDLFVACVGDRYAPDQFQGRAEVSAEFGHILAGGGVVGTVEYAHERMAPPTQVRPIGLLKDADGANINVARYGLDRKPVPEGVTVLGVFGASMNAGKTTAAVSLAYGLAAAGYAVAGAKVTGTGSFGDFVAFEDAGIATLDFTDAGLASTYRVPLSRIEDAFETLVGQAASGGAQIVVVEIADGVFQQETAAILADSRIRDRLDGLLFAAPDALGSVGGVQVLSHFGLRPLAISGMVTRSPLAVQEAMAATGVPHVTREQLSCPDKVVRHFGPVLRSAARTGSIAA